MSSGKPDAVPYLKQAVQSFPEHGLTHYRYAQALEKSGDTTTAVEEYEKARDLDEMPWRAAETTSQMIRDLAQKNNVWLADVEQRFHQVEPQGIGWRLMVDHLHPSIEGQVLLARTVFDTLAEHGWMSLEPTLSHTTIDWHVLARLRGYNLMLEYRVAYMMAVLWERVPMKTNNEQVAGMFYNRTHQIEMTVSSPEQQAIQEGLIEWKEKGKFPDFSFIAAIYCLRAGKPELAKQYFYSSWQQEDDLTFNKMLLACDVLLCSKIMNSPLNKDDTSLAQQTLSEAKIISQLGISKNELGDYYRACGGLFQFLNRHQDALEQYNTALPYLPV